MKLGNQKVYVRPQPLPNMLKTVEGYYAKATITPSAVRNMRLMRQHERILQRAAKFNTVKEVLEYYFCVQKSDFAKEVAKTAYERLKNNDEVTEPRLLIAARYWANEISWTELLRYDVFFSFVRADDYREQIVKMGHGGEWSAAEHNMFYHSDGV
jgi:hypothetical protein